uniref:proline-rich protein 36-like isoform X1 n=1 Tax=Macaca mulatta TaxID=9544 RepID=UPI0010A20830|nr:proline-rich protein 36-like isoform X1 [Macaca mulatta]XP_028693690.1 proline-rich protein 36-like isoform X1 [Macaca mulatta]
MRSSRAESTTKFLQASPVPHPTRTPPQHLASSAFLGRTRPRPSPPAAPRTLVFAVSMSAQRVNRSDSAMPPPGLSRTRAPTRETRSAPATELRSSGLLEGRPPPLLPARVRQGIALPPGGGCLLAAGRAKGEWGGLAGRSWLLPKTAPIPHQASAPPIFDPSATGRASAVPGVLPAAP